MEDREMNDNRWVDERLATLNTAREWRPNAAKAMVQLEQRKRAARSRRRRWFWATVAAVGISIGALLMPVSGACAPPPAACSHLLWETVFRMKAPVTAGPSTPSTEGLPAPALSDSPPVNPNPKPLARRANEFAQASRPAPAPQTPAPAAVRNFKELGSDSAAVVCEVYADYQCPPCATLFRDTIPMLMTQYVETGKVKLRHRDFPLPVHSYARLAARYANAAGQLGHYEAIVDQIFKTQPIWSSSGDIDAMVAQVLPPDVMQGVRELLAHDAKLDETIAADLAMGHEDHLRQTPSLVVVSKGKRQLLPGTPSFSLLKSYIDQVLAEQ
jgi:protein-disulfide isomerase